MNKIAVVGSFTNTAYFGIMGAEVFFAENGEDAADIVKKLIGYAAVFVDERYFEPLAEECYAAADKPSVVPIAMSDKSEKIGEKIMKEYVRNAAGADINF